MRTRAGLSVLVLTSWFGGISPAGAEPQMTEIVTASSRAGAASREAVRAALTLLPRAPRVIAVMDITSATPELRDRLRRLDAFTVQGNGVIYLVNGSELLRGAEKASRFHHAVLAAVIWHEMAHLDGVGEPQARKAEADIWMRFVRDGVIDRVAGLRYLRALEKRPDDMLRAAR